MEGKRREEPKKARGPAGWHSRMTLCWYCRNAVPNPETGAGCAWSKRPHEPVKGWEAERRDLYVENKSSGYKPAESYRVLACPEFEEG